MKYPVLIALSLLSCLSAANAAEGVKIYRCGNEYSQEPCPGAKVIDASDPRDKTQSAQTQDAAKREAALAKQLAQERKEREASQKPTAAAAIKPTSTAAASSSAEHAVKKPKHKAKKKATPVDDNAMSEPMRAPKASKTTP